MGYEDATTQLITTLSEPSRPRPQPLTDDEILIRFGGLIWEAVVAFATDPDLLAEVVWVANTVDSKRQFARARVEERRREQSVGDTVH